MALCSYGINNEKNVIKSQKDTQDYQKYGKHILNGGFICGKLDGIKINGE
jgi:hypothetical protein